jgi:hypothetical protein
MRAKDDLEELKSRALRLQEQLIEVQSKQATNDLQADNEDEENERTINAAVRSLPIARIIVAHRRSTIEMADRIVPIWPAAAAKVSPASPRDDSAAAR